jgi:sugar lactone lactonase YvrE
MTMSLKGRARARICAAAAAAAAVMAVPAAASAATLVKSIGFAGPAGIYAYGMDYDPSDKTILVADYWNYRVKRFTTAGAYLGVVSKPDPLGTGNGTGAPYDVEADMIGNPASAPLWVADQGNSRIVQFTHGGAFMRSIGKNGHSGPGFSGGRAYAVGCGAGKMTIPTHIYADPSSRQLFVSDPRCRQVYIFNHATGAFVGQFKWPGGFQPIPRGIVGDANGIYVLEHNTRAIYLFGRGGVFLRKVAQNADMNDPRGLDLANGMLVAVSAYKNKVYVYNQSSGALVRTWDTTGGPGAGPKFDSIRFPAVDPAGNIYVGDTWGCPAYNGSCSGKDPGYRVYKYSSVGAPLPWSIAAGQGPPPRGGFNQQNGIAISDSDELFVVDTFEQRVQKFAPNATCTSSTNCPSWLMQFAGRQPAGPNSDGVGYPRALTFDSQRDLVWVGDNNNAVLAYTPNGGFVHRFGSQGHGPGQFSGGVQGIRVTSERVYATDYGDCRLQIFNKDALLRVATGSSALVRSLGNCTTQPGARGVEVAPDGKTAWVAATGANAIIRWNLDTGTSTRLGAGCGLGQPWGVTFGPSRQWLYVGSVGNGKIVRMRPDGTGCQIVVSGLRGANFIEFDSAGRMYASDNSKRILVYSNVE